MTLVPSVPGGRGWSKWDLERLAQVGPGRGCYAGSPGGFSVDTRLSSSSRGTSPSGYKGDGLCYGAPEMLDSFKDAYKSLWAYWVIVLSREIFRKLWIHFGSAKGHHYSLGIEVNVASFVFQAGQDCTEAQVADYEANPQSNGVPVPLSTAGLSCFYELIDLAICSPLLEKVLRVQPLG